MKKEKFYVWFNDNFCFIEVLDEDENYYRNLFVKQCGVKYLIFLGRL